MKLFKLLANLVSGLITISWGILWILAESGYELLPIEKSLYEPITYVAGGMTAIIATLSYLVPLLYRKQDAPEIPEQALIEIVQDNWIDGVLKDALRDTQIELDINASPERLNRSSSYQIPVDLRLKDGTTSTPIEHTAVQLLETFRKTGNQLLILGEPGSGKTVLLLQLAERLLEVSEDNPIPVVFNLSSWGEKQGSIEDWLIQRFKIDYGTPDKIAKSWMNGNNLIYLLDGFDEVAEAHREQCLRELNKFINPDRQLVICSRIKEYETLGKPLKAQFAIQIQALSTDKFFDLLHEAIPAETMSAILNFLESDLALLGEINKPLFINILINTYADGRPFEIDNTGGNTIDKVRYNIIVPYITRQLRNVDSPPYNSEETRRYLSWIANNLHQREQTTFYIEMLQPDWLPSPKTPTRFSQAIGLIFGLSFWQSLWQRSWSSNIDLDQGLQWNQEGQIFWQIFKQIFRLSDIDLNQKLRPHQERLILEVGSVRSDINLEQRLQLNREGLMGGLMGGLIFGLMFGPILGLIFGLILGLSSGLADGLSSGLTVGLIAGLTVGLITGLSGGLMGLIFGLMFGLIGKTNINYRVQFNWGLRDTAIMGLIVGLIGWLIGGLVFGLILGLSPGLNPGLNSGLNPGLNSGLGGLIVGLIFGLIFGLGDILKHILLRLLLERQSLVPRRFDTFLLYAIDRRFMRRVGGSAIFKHRYILEYFADYWEKNYAPEFTDD